MGILDDAKKKSEERLAREAGKAAAKQALKGLRRAVGGLADELLDYAEKELEEARAAQQGRDPLPVGEVEAPELPQPQPPPAQEAEVQAPEDESAQREARARQELEALKAAMKEGRRPEPPSPPPQERAAPPSPARQARLEREERARRELQALKRRMGIVEDPEESGN